MRRSQQHIKAFLYLLLVWQLAYSSPLFAGDEFIIKSASTNLKGTVYFLNMVSEIELPGYITAAFEQGFDIPLSMEVEVYNTKRFWLDKEIVYIKQQYRLKYHPMLDAVSILNVNAGRRFYYASLSEALSAVSVILGYPLLDDNNLVKNKTYRVRLRFGIDALELPIPLKSSSLWQNNWGLVSDWYQWEVTP